MARERTPPASDLCVECRRSSQRPVHFAAPGVHALPDARNQELRDGRTPRSGGRPPTRSKAVFVPESPPSFHRAKESQADAGLRRGAGSQTHARRNIPGDRPQPTARPGAHRLATQQVHTRMVVVAPVAGALQLLPMARASDLDGALRVLSLARLPQFSGTVRPTGARPSDLSRHG